MIWDPIRQIWVTLTPEEQVRQRWIRAMIGELGFPKGLLGVEKEIASLSHQRLPPRRRIDLLCWTPGPGGLKPLLLVECKVGPLLAHAERQVWGYNETIGAPFVCLVNGLGARTFWREAGEIASVPFLPAYRELLTVQKRS